MFVVGNKESKADSEMRTVYYEYLQESLEFYKTLGTGTGTLQKGSKYLDLEGDFYTWGSPQVLFVTELTTFPLSNWL